MAWKRDISLTIWAFITAIPGFVAFRWGWRDRKDRIKGNNPYAQIVEISKKEYPDRWILCDIWIYSKWSEPATLTRLVTSKKLEMVKGIRRSLDGFTTYIPGVDCVGNPLDLKVSIPASEQEGKSSKPSILYLFVRTKDSSSSRGAAVAMISRKSFKMSIISHSNRRRLLPIINTTVK